MNPASSLEERKLLDSCPLTSKRRERRVRQKKKNTMDRVLSVLSFSIRNRSPSHVMFVPPSLESKSFPCERFPPKHDVLLCLAFDYVPTHAFRMRRSFHLLACFDESPSTRSMA